jgi:hypothetical protein
MSIFLKQREFISQKDILTSDMSLINFLYTRYFYKKPAQAGIPVHRRILSSRPAWAV